VAERESRSENVNYQHAFHAGNFADVHKHAVLARILVHLRVKPAAFRVIDTHAGAGRYDLLSSAATRGGEWQNGIGRLWQASPSSGLKDFLQPYLDGVSTLNPGKTLRNYPGSPALVQTLLRRPDRLIACELEPKAARKLLAALDGDQRCKALAIDGWTALGAYVPPKERRGLVLIDPPFEETDDFSRLFNELAAAYRKWPTGIYLLWYPIKDRDAPNALARHLRKLALPNVLRSEITMTAEEGRSWLGGSGLILVNPPFQLDGELRTRLPELGQILSRQAVCSVDWLTKQT
jgi:23S rRNA (adenine2030-N6)-methyltransferase